MRVPLAGARPAVGVGAVVLVGLLWVVLAAQVAVLRTRLDRRAHVTVTGGSAPHSPPHPAYVALDAVKVAALPVLGVVLVSGIAS
jgi:hypothetical protein